MEISTYMVQKLHQRKKLYGDKSREGISHTQSKAATILTYKPQEFDKFVLSYFAAESRNLKKEVDFCVTI